MDKYAPWECRAVVVQRAALETARDRRAGYLADSGRTDEFNSALAAFESARAAHIRETGCEDMH